MANARKLQRTKQDQYHLTIPKFLVDALGWAKEDEIEFLLEPTTIEKGDIVLRKKR